MYYNCTTVVIRYKKDEDKRVQELLKQALILLYASLQNKLN